MTDFFKSLPDIAALGGIFLLWIFPRRRRLRRSRFLLVTVCYVYGCGIVAATLFPVLWQLPTLSAAGYTVHWQPFADFLHGWGDCQRQLLLNVGMLLPFGVLLPRLTGWKFGRTLLCAILLMASIELLQPLFHRSCDTTDLITNTIGCAAGYLLGLPLAQPMQRFAGWLDTD